MHFSIDVLVFLISHFVWLLLFTVLTILLAVLRVLFFSALFPGNIYFLLPHFSFISFFIVSLVTCLAIPLRQSPKYTLQICLFLLIIFAPAKAPMTFRMSASFPAENLTSEEDFLLSLFFSYFTASFSMSLSLFPTTKTTPSKLPLCLSSSNISRYSPH